MPSEFRKILLTLGTDIDCQYKDASISVDYTMTFHNHDGYEIFLMLEGNACFYTETSAKEMKRGDLFFILPHAFHHVHPLDDAPYCRVVINFRSHIIPGFSSGQTDLDSIFNRVAPTEINFVHLDSEELAHFLSLTRAMEDAQHSSAFGSDILLEALSKQLLVKINQYNPNSNISHFRQIMPALINETFAYIENHLTEDTFSVQQLADALYHNSSYLNRCFKKIAGISLQQYILAKKIALSQEYLRKGYRLCEACYAAGFHNYSNFSRTFSLQTGMSPKQYQLSLRN